MCVSVGCRWMHMNGGGGGGGGGGENRKEY